MAKRSHIILLGSAVAVALAIGAMMVPSLAGSHVEQLLIEQARAAKINLSIQQPAYFWLGADAAAIDAVIMRPRLFLNLSAQDIALRVSPLSALQLAPSGSLTAGLYGGTAQALFSGNVQDNRGTASIELRNVQLSRHPQFRALGFTGGKLDGTLPRLELARGEISRTEGTLSLTALERSGGLTDLLPLPIKLPPISNGEIRLAFRQEGQKVLIDSLESTSNLGTISARGAVIAGTMQLRLSVALSHEGVSFAGPYLQLISSGKLSSDDGIFQATLSGPLNRPRFEVVEAR